MADLSNGKALFAVAAGSAALIGGLLFLLLPTTWRDWLLSLGVPSQEWIKPFRARFVNVGILGFLVFPGAVAIVFHADFYPYSDYPMYSSVVHRTDRDVVLAYGVPVDETQAEMQLASHKYIEPFQQGRLRRVIYRLAQEEFTDLERDAFLQFMYERYEARRLAGVHQGPPLREIRVYAVRWELDATASNRNHPTEQTLLYAYKP